MPYAVVAAHSGASKTTVTIGGVSYDVYEFASVGGGSVEFAAAGDVDYLIVGGGGAGASGRYYAGSGGGGGDVQQGVIAVPAAAHSIVVGAGGAGSPAHDTQAHAGMMGQNSAALGLTAYGGGRGGNLSAPTPNVPGNGGGGYGANTAGGQSTAGGYNGGFSVDQSLPGGGAGDSADGEQGEVFNTPYKGRGGIGTVSSITGAPVIYGSGGTGGNRYSATTIPAPSGGGYGGTSSEDGGPGTDGLGGGGGGAGNNCRGAKGGSGVVILRVATPVAVTIPGPGKLDLFNARQIKTAAGEWLEAKGPGWHWVRS
ncbi:glycine-rich domain-containing protein [Paracoccus fontiphilus]|uniref:Glycine-rich domain-containing protein n=1 Tax=Paracoccus fontiphilus TaxID=1815556 RepID=A0ABV7IKJ8_9RHOB|nr:hypothetical protein [Paracoccus fontiphilus]